MGSTEKARGRGSGSDLSAERRRLPRGGDGQAYLISPVYGVVTDLGPGGFCVETWEPLAVKRHYAMVVGESAQRSARLSCQVEWCRLVRAERGDNGDVVSVYRLGVSYLGLDARAAMRPELARASGP